MADTFNYECVSHLLNKQLVLGAPFTTSDKTSDTMSAFFQIKAGNITSLLSQENLQTSYLLWYYDDILYSRLHYY